jgi:hypothetical protein
MTSLSTASAPRSDVSPSTRQPRTRKQLIVVSTTLLGLTSVGAAIALIQHLPDGAARSVAGGGARGGFIYGSGTAMSPPLPIMVLFGIAILFAASRRRIGVIGSIALAIGGTAFTAGMLIEPITRYSLTSSLDVVKTPLVVLGLLAAPLTALAAVAELRYRIRREGNTTSTSRAE